MMLALVWLLLLGGTVAMPTGSAFELERYYVEGTLELPYAELVEPFKAWFDGPEKRSRVDFYGGVTTTIQRGDLGKYGQHYLIAPMTTEKVLNEKTCFVVDGEEDAPVTPQPVFPDVTNFTRDGQTTYRNEKVDIWKFVQKRGQRVNTYTLYTQHEGSHLPVFYKMMGFDSLLGSHYDEYLVRYTYISAKFSEDVAFDLPLEAMNCSDFPGPGDGFSGPGSAESHVLANPMREFIHPTTDDHVHEMFESFVHKYEVTSTRFRKDTFRHNVRYINSMNRRDLSYKLGVNHLAAHAPSELKRMRGRRTSTDHRPHARPFTSTLSDSDLPTQLNWRLSGAVTPVKDQATCGSCWSFGAIGSIEGAYFIKHKELVSFSEQNLMDCSWGFGNNACDGGEEWRSYEYALKHGGIMSEEDYGHYRGQDGYCHFSASKVSVKLASYVNVTSGSVPALKLALLERGPVAVGIDASHLSLSFYSHGVYYEEKCGNTTMDLDHAVLAVGYGVMDGQPYTLIKNSWSTHWGNDGYVLMSQKDNNCGVATDATFVVVE